MDFEPSEYSFGKINRKEVEGPIKIEDVAPRKLGEPKHYEELEDPESELEPDTETIWIAEGDAFKHTNEEFGQFTIRVLTIYEIVDTKNDKQWYEVEIEHNPDDENQQALIQKQKLRSFAEEALNFKSIGDAGNPSVVRD